VWVAATPSKPSNTQADALDRVVPANHPLGGALTATRHVKPRGAVASLHAPGIEPACQAFPQILHALQLHTSLLWAHASCCIAHGHVLLHRCTQLGTHKGLVTHTWGRVGKPLVAVLPQPGLSHHVPDKQPPSCRLSASLPASPGCRLRHALHEPHPFRWGRSPCAACLGCLCLADQSAFAAARHLGVYLAVCTVCGTAHCRAHPLRLCVQATHDTAAPMPTHNNSRRFWAPGSL
jgi:hypothetical protein